MNYHTPTDPEQQTENTLPFKAVIFDMDGTLIASTGADYLAWKKLFAAYGRTLSFEQYFPLLGRKSADVVQHFLGLEGAEALQAMQKKMDYFAEVVRTTGIQFIPFADCFVQQVKQTQVKVGLATSSRRPKTELVLKQLGLYEAFDAITTGEEVASGKPAPDIFLKAAEKLQVPPEACLVVEDTVSGVQAAKNARMKCMAITTSHQAAQLWAAGADVVIDTFEAQDFARLCYRFQGQ